MTSRGELVMAELSSADRDAVERLFRDQPRAAAPMPDGFRYRITRQDATHTRTVEVVESDVPAVLRNCVRDELA